MNIEGRRKNWFLFFYVSLGTEARGVPFCKQIITLMITISKNEIVKNRLKKDCKFTQIRQLLLPPVFRFIKQTLSQSIIRFKKGKGSFVNEVLLVINCDYLVIFPF